MRARQAMQTGGKSRSAIRPTVGRTMPEPLAREEEGASSRSSASPVGMVLNSGAGRGVDVTPLRSRKKARACSPQGGSGSEGQMEEQTHER